MWLRGSLPKRVRVSFRPTLTTTTTKGNAVRDTSTRRRYKSRSQQGQGAGPKRAPPKTHSAHNGTLAALAAVLFRLSHYERCNLSARYAASAPAPRSSPAVHLGPSQREWLRVPRMHVPGECHARDKSVLRGAAGPCQRELRDWQLPLPHLPPWRTGTARHCNTKTFKASARNSDPGNLSPEPIQATPCTNSLCLQVGAD
jgi:hypothetical protein